MYICIYLYLYLYTLLYLHFGGSSYCTHCNGVNRFNSQIPLTPLTLPSMSMSQIILWIIKKMILTILYYNCQKKKRELFHYEIFGYSEQLILTIDFPISETYSVFGPSSPFGLL